MKMVTSSMKRKTTHIAGSSGGIGFNVAEHPAEVGCNVVLHRNEPEETFRRKQVQLARTDPLDNQSFGEYWRIVTVGVI